MTFPSALPGPLPLDRVAAWMMTQRWYANKGSVPPLEEIGRLELAAHAADVELVVHLLLDHTAGSPALYQVPLSYRAEPLPDGTALLGHWGDRFVYDAPHDPEFSAALLGLLLDGGELPGDRTHAAAQRSRTDLSWIGAGLASHVLSAEQSNTSIVFEPDGDAGSPVILKLFRSLHDGANPDVELQGVLADAGSAAVPRAVGSIVADWPDRGHPAGRAHGHLAVAQEFLTGALDGWAVALDCVRRGADFRDAAFALGVATAGVHGTLAAHLDHRPMEAEDIVGTVAQMRGRLAAAIAAVPALAPHAPALDAAIVRAERAQWPDLQRIHGDLHLGQALLVPQRDWVIVDFEGEPLRPMSERTRLDSPLRDIAGMLRSFDYVAGSVAITGALAHATAWVANACAAFTAGYGEASGRDLDADRDLVDAFEIDKALYETVYEVRNRPAWLPIPLAAIERLAARAAG